MNDRWETWWGVEWEKEGRSECFFDYAKHANAEEAKRAFAEHRGISWEDAERQGARIVQQQVQISESK